MAKYPELAGRTAIVTGAARGIGRAIAEALSQEGAGVALLDMASKEDLDRAAKQVGSCGGEARAYACDIREAAAVQETVDAVASDFGGVYILVNNAGVTADSVFWKMLDDQWSRVIETNLTGSFHMSRAVAPHLRAKRQGRIVSIASINALRGKFGQANYAASKAGVIGLTLAMARELARETITVNAIAPGFIETDMTRDLPEEILEQARRECALGRFGKPADVAAAVLFFCSDGAAHITGTVLRVDGGQCL